MWNLIPWKKNNPSAGGGLMTADPVEREFSRIREDFDSLLKRMWGGSPLALDRLFDHRWAFDFDETDSHYVARVEAPGFEVEDFDVHTSGNHLVVKAERKESQNGNGKNGNGSSYRYGRFYQTIPLPDGAQSDQIEARYHSGVLELKIPKGKESENVKRIAVKSY